MSDPLCYNCEYAWTPVLNFKHCLLLHKNHCIPCYQIFIDSSLLVLKRCCIFLELFKIQDGHPGLIGWDIFYFFYRTPGQQAFQKCCSVVLKKCDYFSELTLLKIVHYIGYIIYFFTRMKLYLVAYLHVYSRCAYYLFTKIGKNCFSYLPLCKN